MIFRALVNHYEDPILTNFFFAAGKFLNKKQVKNAAFGNFLKNVYKKLGFFFGARFPSKLVYIGAEGTSRKILGFVNQKWMS